MRRKLQKKIIAMTLTCVLLAGLTACGGNQAEEVPGESTETENAGTENAGTSLVEIPGELEIVAKLDETLLTVEGENVYFTLTTPEGKEVRFQGMGDITVSDGKLVMESGAMLFSLDYIGEIKNIVAAGEGWIDFGMAYAETESVSDMMKLYTAIPHTIGLSEEISLDVTSYKSSFLALGASGSEPLVLDRLMVEYEPEAEQMTYDMLETETEAMAWLNDYAVDWSLYDGHEEEVSVSVAAKYLAERKMEEPGSIYSDIIAGIDYDSIETKGNITLFNSVMSDGEVIRFEGKNISISEEGMMICADSVVTSLDALGKIYLYGAVVENAGNEEEAASNSIDVGYAYTYSADLTSVDSMDELHTYLHSGYSVREWNAGITISMAAFDPNFVYFSGNVWNERELLLSSMTVGYNPAEKVTAITDMTLNVDMSGSYISGEEYHAEKEGLADLAEGSFDFYLILKPDTEIADMTDPEASIFFVPNTFYKIGDLRDADGNILDKKKAKVYPGTTLDITVGDYTVAMELPVQAMYADASNMHELLPYGTADALGEQYTLVVPVVWADQTDMATDENLTLYKKAMGRIIEEDGSVVDYTDTQDKMFSVSEYFDTASYGKLQVKSFMTDWYYIDRDFAEAANAQPEKEYADEILTWVKETYPDMDLSQFDRDGNGYVDSMVIINAGEKQGDGYSIISYGGAIWYRESYYGDYAGTGKNPEVNAYVTVNHGFLEDGNTAVLLHEFSHNFGLIDYYDVTYSGINAVGGFDMQSDNVGDWNAYSKLAVGWMEPQVVTGLASGESVELTLTSSALTDDVILIPAAGTEYTGPFSEYIMLDMFSDDGVNIYDTKAYGLKGAAGVRISHVDALMEQRTMEVESKVNPGETDSYDIGTIHYANAYTDDGKGYYNIEVIQSGGVNTFTNLEKNITKLTADDLFYAGDTFSVEEYDEFFYDGLMDNGESFGYTISIVSIGENEDGCPYAVVRITAQ